jgi:hypothetical protein
MQSALPDGATQFGRAPKSQERRQRNLLLIRSTKATPPGEICDKTIHTGEMLEDDRPSAALLVGTAVLLAVNLALVVVVLVDVAEYITAVWGH